MIVSLNDEVYDEYNFPEHDIMVYTYESMPYEGQGFAAWVLKDKFYYGSLGH